ncbi:hypothetical protein D3C73_699780 [compost metagenome]
MTIQTGKVINDQPRCRLTNQILRLVLVPIRDPFGVEVLHYLIAIVPDLPREQNRNLTQRNVIDLYPLMDEFNQRSCFGVTVVEILSFDLALDTLDQFVRHDR